MGARNAVFAQWVAVSTARVVTAADRQVRSPSRAPRTHIREAFEYFRTNGVGRVICEEKHMGSRAVAIVCRDAEVARKRFPTTRKPLDVFVEGLDLSKSRVAGRGLNYLAKESASGTQKHGLCCA